VVREKRLKEVEHPMLETNSDDAAGARNEENQQNGYVPAVQVDQP